MSITLRSATQTGPVSATTKGSPLTHDELDKNFQAFAAADGSGSSNVTHIASGTGAGPRTVQAKEREIVSVTDFYANGSSGALVTGDGTTDCTAGIQAAITQVSSRGGVYFPQPSSSYLVTNTITISGGGITLFGWNQAGSQIKFAPTASKPLFKFSSGGATTIAQSGMWGLRLIATGETTYVKTAVQVIDGEEIELGHISIANWSDSTHSSVGFEIQGRQTVNVHDITVNADLPFSLKVSPNTSTVACDHFHFHNIYAIAHSTQPVFEIDSDVWLTNCTWSGYQAWAQGTYGIYWDASSAANRSYNVSIQNARWEQSTNATGYMLYINPKAFSTALNVENCYTDGSHKGFYFRNFVSGTVRGNVVEGLSESLNVASAGVVLTIQDNFFNLNAGATVDVTGFTGAWINNDAAGSNTATGDITGNTITAREQVLADGTAAQPAFARTTGTDMGLDFNNDGPTMSVGGAAISQWKSTGLHPVGHDTFDLGEAGNAYKGLNVGVVGLIDGVTAPGTTAGVAKIYVDTADGDLKIKFGDGTVKTIATDT